MDLQVTLALLELLVLLALHALFALLALHELLVLISLCAFFELLALLALPARVEICRDRHDRRSCKICASCVKFPVNQRDFSHNLRRTTRFTHTKCDFALKLLKSTHSVKL